MDGTENSWSVADSLELYGLRGWGKNYFGANAKGHVTVGTGNGDGSHPGIDLKELVHEVAERGIGLPLLVRFSELIEARVNEIHTAFRGAMEEFGFRGSYRGVYPIKVNQDHFLVRDLVHYGRPYHYGLEAGSKPELMAVMAMLDDPEALVVCNGYKDEEYIETALLASRLGPKVILVVEKPGELRLIADTATKIGVEPLLGIRARLSTRGSGHWEASGGDRSKFGLGAREIVEAVDFLRQRDMLGSLVLLHFHLGSQISSIRNVKDALREAGWMYVNLVKMGVPLVYFDVGGGLGVDYDGSQTTFNSSMNYTLQEYANDVVYGIMEVCDPAGVAHPVVVTEAGRATVAHHAVLVLDVLGVSEFRAGSLPEAPPEDASPVLTHLFEAYATLTTKNARETYHDALQYRDELLTLFNLGHLSLEHRVLAEDLFWALCQKVRDLVQDLPQAEDEVLLIDQALADTYFCNFSVFQSLPDSWAIEQVFPVMPIHRLDERPTCRGMIADITCDSDGKIDRFIAERRVRSTLDLHRFDGESPYFLGVFLVGAYQESLGDLHNLFGDTNTIHVAPDREGGYRIEQVVSGDTVNEVLQYVGYQRENLVARLRQVVEEAIRARRMTREQARQLIDLYQQGLSGYTYLEQG